jgi:dTDP-4-dehydrorhamnose 3,5-epimerase
MSQFSIIDTTIEGLQVVERKPITDNRGSFARVFCAEELKRVGWRKSVAQINLTTTKKRGTIRGLHFQTPPSSEMKLVSCLQGEIWDVAIDLRKNSPTFLRWHAERLSAENCRELLIPEGFAHGFQTLTDDCELLYLHSASYSRELESGIRPSDPRIAVAWPINCSEISIRDLGHHLLDDEFEGIES